MVRPGPAISRQGVRAAFETRFSSTAMARRYLSIYAQLRRSGAAVAGYGDRLESKAVAA